MKYLAIISGVFCCLAFYTNCSSTAFTTDAAATTTLASTTTVTTPSGTATTTPVATTANQIPVSVGCGYVNEPCVSVTICEPGTNNCQTIPNVLLDTGSYGLRLFSSQVSLNLPAVTNGSGATYAECVSYADGASDWGPVAKADIVLGGQTASSIPMQLINSAYGSIPSNCTDPDTDPSSTGFNGILGVGLFADDCGPGCATDAANEIYYVCGSSGCTGSEMPEAAQVSNPVPFLPAHNNGLVLTLPAVAAGGAPDAPGTLTFGIGTATNNIPGAVSVFLADGYGDFGTTFNGTSYDESFIDSGSNGLYFPGPSTLTQCNSNGDFAGFFCPSGNVTLSGTQQGASSSASEAVSFTIGNSQTALDSGYAVLPYLGGDMDGAFDWGLPFFFGRSIYLNFDGKTSTLATGAAWAY